MMACVAHRILAAPFAVIGSIGVVAQLPNFNRLLRKNEIDLELHTAGEFKRTLTLFGENTEAGREKFREELEDTHALFKSFVAQNRPVVEIDKVATGEHWYGTRAVGLKLIDELRTSDDYLLSRAEEADVFELRWRAHRPLTQRLGLGRILAGRRSLENLDGLTPTRMDW
jgi:serine protease SohB